MALEYCFGLSLVSVERLFACCSDMDRRGSPSGMFSSMLETHGESCPRWKQRQGSGVVCESGRCRRTEKAVLPLQMDQYHMIYGGSFSLSHKPFESLMNVTKPLLGHKHAHAHVRAHTQTHKHTHIFFDLRDSLTHRGQG